MKNPDYQPTDGDRDNDFIGIMTKAMSEDSKSKVLDMPTFTERAWGVFDFAIANNISLEQAHGELGFIMTIPDDAAVYLAALDIRDNLYTQEM